MSWITQEERLYILRWYASDEVTNEEMASDLGMGLAEFFEACTEVGLRPRVDPDVYMPTAEDIERETAKIRLAWDEETVEARLRPASGGIFNEDE